MTTPIKSFEVNKHGCTVVWRETKDDGPDNLTRRNFRVIDGELKLVSEEKGFVEPFKAISEKEVWTGSLKFDTSPI